LAPKQAIAYIYGTKLMVINSGNGVNPANNAAGKAREGAAHSAVETPKDSPKPADSSASADNVSLSHKGQSLQRVENAIANVDAVDSAKVSNIKSAIEDGSYQSNSFNLAGKILAQDDFL